MIDDPNFLIHLPIFQSLMFLLYVGPDQVMPLLSVLGAVVGVVLMWWRRLAMLARRLFRSSTAKQEVSTKSSK